MSLADVIGLYQLKAEETALIVVDMQRGFLDVGAAMEVPQGRGIVPNIRRLIETCRKVGAPVIYTQFVWSPDVPNLIGELHDKHKPPVACCMIGDPSADIVPELAPKPGELVVVKHGYDAFRGTNLDAALRTMGRTRLIVTGVMTDVCVLATVVSALHLECRVSVVSDGAATKGSIAQRITLELVDRCYGRTMTTAEAIRELSA